MRTDLLENEKRKYALSLLLYFDEEDHLMENHYRQVTLGEQEWEMASYPLKLMLLGRYGEFFDNYIPNVDERTKILNFKQEVEQDAYGYGLALLDMYYIKKKDYILRYSMPYEAFVIADSRSMKYR